MDTNKTEANGGIADVLREARDLISDPERWTRDAGARDAKGNEVNSRSESAVRWCAIGALHRVSPNHAVRDSAGVVLREALVFGEFDWGVDVLSFNDTHSHAEVLALFDRAIELAEQAGD